MGRLNLSTRFPPLSFELAQHKLDAPGNDLGLRGRRRPDLCARHLAQTLHQPRIEAERHRDSIVVIDFHCSALYLSDWMSGRKPISWKTKCAAALALAF